MGFEVLPPRERMVDDQGLITPSWYRFFVQIQRVIGGPSNPFEDGIILAGSIASMPEAQEDYSSLVSALPFADAPRYPQFMPAPITEPGSLTAGPGMTGGGNIGANVSLAVGAGLGITVNADDVQLDTSHVRNVDHSAVSITAGNGMTGGGTIAATRTLTLGTPSSVTLASTNTVTTTSHTHAFAPGGTSGQYIRGDGSLATFPTLGTIASQNASAVAITGGTLAGITSFAHEQTGDNFSITYYGGSAVLGGNIMGGHAGGTPGSPTQALSGYVLSGYYGRGYRSTGAWSNAVWAIRGVAAEDFSGTGNGTQVEVSTTAIGATSRSTRFTWSPSGSFYGNATPSTSMTAGFIYLHGTAGAPTGSPESVGTNQIPICIDRTNSRIYANIGGTWKYAALT